MTSGVYERTPAHCTAISEGQKGVSKTPEHCAAISKALTGIPNTPEHKAAISAALTGVPRKPFTSEHRAAMSAAHTDVSFSPAQIDALEPHWENMRGGGDIVWHHTLYDHDDLSKNRVAMTRRNHTMGHRVLQLLGIEISHINIKEE